MNASGIRGRTVGKCNETGVKSNCHHESCVHITAHATQKLKKLKGLVVLDGISGDPSPRRSSSEPAACRCHDSVLRTIPGGWGGTTNPLHHFLLEQKALCGVSATDSLTGLLQAALELRDRNDLEQKGLCVWIK